ncbi:hypothetical protein NPIL_162501 [Nephila pilipes]|uniref:Uncharacterized protein n=1 Tax=Nephila pilipes TaxID=299642 RepID=A0A8X6PFV6_NEPPI|nr:hypothetical protein NPIL_162501 [Nephila pilipes]
MCLEKKKLENSNLKWTILRINLWTFQLKDRSIKESMLINSLVKASTTEVGFRQRTARRKPFESHHTDANFGVILELLVMIWRQAKKVCDQKYIEEKISETLF